MNSLKQTINRKILHTKISLAASAIQTKNRILSKHKIESNILVFGVARSGTTWLAELFALDDRTAFIWEPFTVTTEGFRLKSLNETDFTYLQYIPADAKWPEIKAFFRQLLSGKLLTFDLLKFNSVSKIISAQGFSIKFIRSTMLLPWLVNTFELPPPVYVIRHPLAVVSSMLRYPGFKGFSKYYIYRNRFNDILVEKYGDILDSLKTPEENLAAKWCIENLVPLSSPYNNKKWITVSYEKLLIDSEEEVLRIFRKLNKKPPVGIYDKIKKPSRTTNLDSPILKNGDQIQCWRKFLSSSQVKLIMDTVKKFGINIYDEGPEPDYDILQGKRNAHIS